MVLAAVGLGLCLWALYQYLAAAMDPASATLVTGLVSLLTAGVLAWVVQRLTR